MDDRLFIMTRSILKIEIAGEGHEGMTVTEWNDADDRTAAEVADTLEAAADRIDYRGEGHT